MVMKSPETWIQSAALYPVFQGLFEAVRVTGGNDWKWLKEKKNNKKPKKTQKKPPKNLWECFDLKSNICTKEAVYF